LQLHGRFAQIKQVLSLSVRRVNFEQISDGRMGEIEDHESSDSTTQEKMVEIVLKTIGPARPSRLRVPYRIKVTHQSCSD